MANPDKALSDAVADVERALDGLLDHDAIFEVQVNTHTDAVNAKREEAGFSPVPFVAYAKTKSIQTALEILEAS